MNWHAKCRLLLTHFGGSVLIAIVVAYVIYGVWYPGVYASLSGGGALFGLIVGVDLVMGPLLMVIVYNDQKKKAERIVDVGVILAVQLFALFYGLHVLFDARPIATVFETDRFRVVAANEVLLSELTPDSLGGGRLQIDGPALLAVRASKDGTERIRSLELAVSGFDAAQRPAYWIPYAAASREQAWRRAKPIADLTQRWPGYASQIQLILAKAKQESTDVRYLPMQGRKSTWTVLLNRQGDLLGYVEHDGFL